MESYYGNLCTEFYDLTEPWALKDEINFYQKLLGNTREPILEAMCGTGRLLLPLLELGFNIEGVDNSESMLAKCRDKAKEKNLSPLLYKANIADMVLDKKYHAIIIAVGSFQLIHPRETALVILKNLKSHLMPGGKLLLDTFIRYDTLSTIKNNITEQIQTKDNSIIKISIQEKSNIIEQYVDSIMLYEKIKNNQIIQSETEKMRISWYYKYEFKMFLEQAGFNLIKLHQTDYEINKNGIVYEAIA